MDKLRIVAIVGRKDLDSIAHGAGVFEKSKMLAWPVHLSALLHEGVAPKDVDLDKIFSVLKDALSQNGATVAAVFSPDFSTAIWLDESVISISNGHSWTLLDNVLDAYGMTEAKMLNRVVKDL